MLLVYEETDDPNKKTTDITKKFKKVSTLHGAGANEALQKMYYDVSLVADDFDVEYKYTHKWLTCEASIPGSGFPKKSMRVKVTLEKCKCKINESEKEKKKNISAIEKIPVIINFIK